MGAAGEAAFARQLMLGAGLFSMAVAGVFMIRQRDYKRLLAYSSVEHLGIMAVGVGLGGGAVFGSLLHVLNNGLTKLVLFLSAGNIHRAFGSKRLEQTRGAIRVVPFSGILLVLGFLAITGSPPFGTFLSEFTIFDSAVTSGRGWVAFLFLAALALVFLGMSATILSVVQGKPEGGQPPAVRGEGLLTILPALVALALVLLLGIYLPPPLELLLRRPPWRSGRDRRRDAAPDVQRPGAAQGAGAALAAGGAAPGDHRRPARNARVSALFGSRPARASSCGRCWPPTRPATCSSPAPGSTPTPSPR